MTRAGVIPLSEIERIQFYFNTKKLRSTKTNLKKILQETGGSFVTNATIFPFFGKFVYSSVKFISVVRTVIHTNHCNRKFTICKTFVQTSYNFSNI